MVPWYRRHVECADGADLVKVFLVPMAPMGAPMTVSRGGALMACPMADLVFSIGAPMVRANVREHGTGEDGLLFRDHPDAPIGRNRFGDLWRATSKRAGRPTVRCC